MIGEKAPLPDIQLRMNNGGGIESNKEYQETESIDEGSNEESNRPVEENHGPVEGSHGPVEESHGPVKETDVLDGKNVEENDCRQQSESLCPACQLDVKVESVELSNELSIAT